MSENKTENKKREFGIFKNKLVLSLTIVTIAAVALMIVTLSGGLPTNNLPIVLGMEADKDYLVAGESCSIQVQAGDPDGDILEYVWSAAAGDITGGGKQVDWTAPESLGSYTIVVDVSDGRSGLAKAMLTLEVVANNPPVIESVTTSRNQVNRGEAVIIECTAVDPDGNSLVYDWTVPEGVIYGSGPVVAWQTPAELGYYEIEVEVADGRGGSAVAQAEIEVAVNNPPEIESLESAESSVLYGRTTSVTCVASDPDGDTLSYRWTTENGEITGSGSVIEWLATADCGDSSLVSVQVFDDRGGEVSAGISIRTRKPG